MKITGIMASFRDPKFVSGVQPTLEVPPPNSQRTKAIINNVQTLCQSPKP